MERKLRSRKKITETIWKCLEWIIYLSLMATAILFAREVIEKFFGQYTGIKQNMEKIELHPTVTICPFLEQCDGPMKLILRLQGEAKEIKYLAGYEGSYNILSSELINGKPYWIHKYDQEKALWYSTEEKLWLIGQIKYIGGKYIGGDTANFFSTDKVPYDAYWYFFNNDQSWKFTTTDVVVELGKYVNTI